MGCVTALSVVSLQGGTSSCYWVLPTFDVMFGRHDEGVLDVL